MTDLFRKKVLGQFINKKSFQIPFVGLMFILSLIPLILLARILVTTGADSVSNDYLQFAKLANRILSSGYDWRFYFKDTLFNDAHSYAFLFLFRLGLAQLSHLSVRTEIYIGLVLASVNLGIEYFLLTRFFARVSIWRFLLLPILSFLTFSFSQISTFSYGETTLQMGFTHLGILLGLWVILLQGRSRFSVWAIMMSGIFASYSGGSGLLAWPVFLLGVILTDCRNLKKYVIWLVGAGIGLFPYLAYSNFSPLLGNTNFLNVLSLKKLVTILGFSMANNINTGVQEHHGAYLAGLFGLGCVLLIGLILFFYRSRFRFQPAMAAILLVFWGLIGALQIAVLRSTIAPWYSTTVVLFWIGLSGLCMALLMPGPVASRKLAFNWNTIIKLSGAGLLVGIALLFLWTNRTYKDKSLFLSSRSPSSAACLRNYPVAPTYCEGLVFQWGVGNPSFLYQLGSLLDKYHWSVLGPDQQWTLQGDEVLGNVSLISNSKSDEIRWVVGDQDEAANWIDYEHLNILLYPGQTIQWQVDLPQNVDSVKLQMGLSLAGKTRCDQQSIDVQIELASGAENKSIFHQKDLCSLTNGKSFNEDLLAYAGKRMNILISNQGNFLGRDTAMRIYYPQIVLHKTAFAQSNGLPSFESQPFNTDLSPDFVSRTLAGGNPPILFQVKPELQNFILTNNNGLMVRNGSLSKARYDLAQPDCLSKGSQLYFSLALTDAVQKKKVRILFPYLTENNTYREAIIDFPLLAGEALHAYTLDMSVLNLPATACISGVEFQLIEETANSIGQWMQIDKLGFLRRN